MSMVLRGWSFSGGIDMAHGSLSVLDKGTTRPATDIFADDGGKTPSLNPLRLDEKGAATVYGRGSYDVTVKDRLGNVSAAFVVDQLDAA